LRPFHRLSELVAAQARQRVLAAQRVAQALGDRAHQRVARRVAERVVHQLEAVQVDAQQRELRAAARRGEDRLADAVAHQHAVGQPGEDVARGEELDARLGLLARGDVGGGAAVAARHARRVAHRHRAHRKPDRRAGRSPSGARARGTRRRRRVRREPGAPAQRREVLRAAASSSARVKPSTASTRSRDR
jgi:hypothetical protein